jgi:asparagine synthase (glutamine-hydrolysing)
MYEYYGDDFLLRMRGIFALAVYDKRKSGRERLFLARDHFGIKPLLYSDTGKHFIFGSEIKAMLASSLINPTVDPNGLRLLLTFGSVYQPNTILENIKSLLPAHKLIIESGKDKRIERYWSLGINRNAGVRHLSYNKQVKLMESTLKEVTEMQMISDVPLGAFLSGGIDSSILVALMTQATTNKIKTFSVGFENADDIDESNDAEKMACHIGTDHSKILVTESDIYNNIHKIAAGLDQPSVDGTNSYVVSMAARKNVTVAISGTGGDEIFAGYPWFISMSKQDFWSKIKRLSYVFDRNKFLTEYSSHYYIYGSRGAQTLIPENNWNISQAGTPEYIDIKPTDELSHGSPIERTSGLVLRGYTSNQLLRDIDAVSMYHSLEIRVPYLDPVLADLALSLPDSAKLHNLNTDPHATYRSLGAKRILIDIGRNLLPKNFDLQSKRGFSMPFDTWLQGSLNEIMDETLSYQSVKARGLLNPDTVNTIKLRYDKKQIGWTQPWLLMMLELWCREVLDHNM